MDQTTLLPPAIFQPVQNTQPGSHAPEGKNVPQANHCFLGFVIYSWKQAYIYADNFSTNGDVISVIQFRLFPMTLMTGGRVEFRQSIH